MTTSRSKARSFAVLAEIEWRYPPEDGIRYAHEGGWNRPARCPVCFAEYNLKAVHNPGCALKAALLNDARAILKGK